MSLLKSDPEASWRWYHRATERSSDAVLPIVRRVNFHDPRQIVLLGRLGFANFEAVVQSGRLPPFASPTGKHGGSLLTIPDRYHRELEAAYRAIGVDPDPFTRRVLPLQLRVGRRYFTRSGSLEVKITGVAGFGEFNGVVVGPSDGGRSTWLPNGRFFQDDTDHDYDLVYEAA